MGDRGLLTDELLEELESLRREVIELRAEKAAKDAQSELLEQLVAMARSSAEGEMLKATLKNTLDVSTRLTNAESGSLFLYDSKGAVTASILTRKDATAEESTNLVGIVLKEGLAGWVSRHRQVGLILDTDNDDRWVTLPNQPYEVGSALAIPILRGETLLGLLTLLHCQPRHFSTQDAHLMQLTAEQIALALENAQLYTKLDQTKAALANELEKGRQIQIDFLPDSILQPTGWEIAARFFPARQLAGDFYDVFPLPGGYVGLVIADVCDKGVGAALFMALFRSLIRIFSGQAILQGFGMLSNELSITSGTESPHMDALKAVSLTSNYIAQTSQMGMFATMFFGVLEPNTGLLSYVNGGHELPIIVDSAGVVKHRLKPTGPAVGMMPNLKFKAEQVQLEPGDIVMTYTDGVPEAHSPDGTFFTEKQLLSLVEQSTTSASEMLDKIEASLRAHMGDRDQFDDITMLAVRWASR